MIPVKTLPRFKCDFCSRRGIAHNIAKHEKICFRNPDRFCDLCENKGEYTEHFDEGISQTTPCYYCSQFDATRLPEELKREIQE